MNQRPKADSAPLDRLPSSQLELILRKATTSSDPALTGVAILMRDIGRAYSRKRGHPAAEKRYLGLLRFAQSERTPTLAALSPFYGESKARALLSSWPAIRALAKALTQHERGLSSEESALEWVVEGGSAAAMIGGGDVGRKVRSILARPRTTDEDGALNLSLVRRPLKSTQYDPQGSRFALKRFTKVVASRRISDADSKARTLRRYRAKGVDTSSNESVARAGIEARLAQRDGIEGRWSAREIARALRVPLSTFLRAARTALERRVVTPVRTKRGALRYTSEEVKILRSLLQKEHR